MYNPQRYTRVRGEGQEIGLTGKRSTRTFWNDAKVLSLALGSGFTSRHSVRMDGKEHILSV